MDRNPLKVDQNQSDLLEKGSKLSQFNQKWIKNPSKLKLSFNCNPIFVIRFKSV